MYGKVICKSILVDCFEQGYKNGIYFLTDGEIGGPIPEHVDRVYTSTHNAWLLKTKWKVDPDKIVSLSLDQQFRIQDKIKKLDFYVTLLDAKQRPGAVMFLFEGKEIGNILYAGKCCYGDNFFSKPLTNFLKVKLVDYLYVHAACEGCQSHSMSVSEAIDEIVNTVRWNPNCKIMISEPNFREDILKNLKLKLQEPICVSLNIMKHLEDHGIGSDFQLDQNTARVIVTDRSIGKVSRFKQPVLKIVLVPCSLRVSEEELQSKVARLEKKGYHVILYRNHCSTPELVTLVRCINAKHTVQIRPPVMWRHPSERPRDLTFWSHLKINEILEFYDDLENRSTTEVNNSVVTESESAGVEVVTLDDTEEVDPPESFILIESDAESNMSQNSNPLNKTQEFS